MADDRVQIVFGAEFSELTAGVQQIRELVLSLGPTVKAVGEDFTAASAQMVQAPDSAVSAWRGAAGSLETTFDGMLKGVLLGTQTWQEGLQRIFANVVASFAEMAANMAIEWAATGLGAAASSGGIFGALGGLLGGGGGDAGAIGELAMFATGAWSIPRDMVALVHAGEMILPADVAAMARSGGSVSPFAGSPASTAGQAPGGTGLTLNVNVSAMDASGVAQWANANAQTLATTIARYLGNNPSTRDSF
jgi:hypothetical protein